MNTTNAQIKALLQFSNRIADSDPATAALIRQLVSDAKNMDATLVRLSLSGVDVD